MSLLSEIRKLEYKDVFRYTSAFFGTVATGFLIIYHFKPELIEKYDILKLAFLSLALTLPLMEINAIISGIMFHKLPGSPESETEKNIEAVMGALKLNVMVIYPSLLVCYLWSLNFKWFLGMVAALEFFLFIFGLVWLLTSAAKTQA